VHANLPYVSVKKNMRSRIVFCLRTKSLTKYKRHQIVITELEIGAVGTDFSRRTPWWAREDPGRARTWKSMKNKHLFKMYTNTENDHKCTDLIYFWMKLGASWTRRWCPTSPQWSRSSKLYNNKNVSNNNLPMDKCSGKNNFQTLRPENPPIPYFCSKKLSGASPYVELS
jgi:hypothetical protein